MDIVARRQADCELDFLGGKLNTNIINSSAICTLDVDGEPRKLLLVVKEGLIPVAYLASDPTVKVYPYSKKGEYKPSSAMYSNCRTRRIWSFKAPERRDDGTQETI